TASATAAAPATQAGRYQISPDERGFVRLDTETGAMSHCGQQQGVWRCEPLAEGNDIARQLDELSATVSQLSEEFSQLEGRLARLESSAGSTSSGSPPALS